jgi:hypothetical protein
MLIEQLNDLEPWWIIYRKGRQCLRRFRPHWHRHRKRRLYRPAIIETGSLFVETNRGAYFS